METHIPRIPNNSNATPVEIPAKPKVAGMEQTQQITPEMRKAIPTNKISEHPLHNPATQLKKQKPCGCVSLKR